LGLALVRQLVELHGGVVGVESEGVPGQGSRFTVSLPWRGAVSRFTGSERTTPMGSSR
jgi:signal transduction histidine kinase